MNKNLKERLQEIYDSTIDDGTTYTGNIDDIDFYSLLCKSTSENKLYKFLSCNLFMFKYKFEGDESILIVFSIPTSLNLDNNQQENKHISERIMEVLKVVEECFVTTDYMNLKNIVEDKFLYLIIIKKIKDESED